MPSKATVALERVGFGIYYRFRSLREPVTEPICRLLARLHVTPAYLTAARALLLVAFFFVWTAGYYAASASLLTVSLLLDALDGDLARMLRTDSDLGGFQDQTVDTLMVVILAVSLARQGLVPGWLCACYVFVTTTSWWISVIRGTETKKTDWIFKPETTPVVHFSRLWVITSLIYAYAFLRVDVFSAAMAAVSAVLTVYTAWDFYSIARRNPEPVRKR
jgi:phosphatidylglycerophosphate synthase